MILYRPVGKRELELIEQSGYRAFPPRLPEQPIFYPVLNQRYAEEIAGRWNTRDARSGYRGYVTRFEVEDRYISRFESHIVGASWHEEFWIPAGELEEFNRHILGRIEVVKTFGPEEEPEADGGMLRMSSDHAAHLREVVERAGKADPMRRVFGAQKHQYCLNPVVSREEVERFEARYNVKLPPEYVFFITQVGNGGAGPYYGLYPLEKMAAYTEYLEVYDKEDMQGLPAFIDRRMTREDWAAAMERAEDDTAYDKVMKEVCAGLLVIGTQGCTYDNLLMWKGSEQGKIVYIDWNLEPEYGPFLTGMSFLDWYESYFQEIIAGNSVTSYGYRSLKSEEELAALYPAVETSEERRQILMGFFRFNRVEPGTVEFLAGLRDPELDGLRTELLFRFDPARGFQVFEELLDGRNPAGAVDCARRMPDENKDRYYSQMAGLLGRPEVREKSRLLFFLNDCSCRRAKDLADFAADPKNDEESRKTAVYVMGCCPDRMDFLPLFKALMRGDSYWLAHTALQAVAKTPCMELLETYEWMWDKYKRDKVMRSNLMIAFKNLGINRE